MKTAILQSAYIPWRGYFDLIASVDTFVFYDDVQFSHGDWRNRNRIRTANGTKWLTIPVPKKHRIQKQIREVEVSEPNWGADHWARIWETYRRAPNSEEISTLLKPLYDAAGTNLTQINASFVRAICGYLGIETPIVWSWDYATGSGKTQRLVEICQATNSDVYVSGPAAKAYLDESAFAAAGISVEWFSYDRLEPYPQIHGGFEGAVSVIDLLFNCGAASRRFLPTLQR